MRGLVVFMLILVAVAPFAKATSDSSNTVESPQYSLGVIASSNSDKGNTAQSAGSSSTLLQNQIELSNTEIGIDQSNNDYQNQINKYFDNIYSKGPILREMDNEKSNSDAQSGTINYLKYLSEKSIANADTVGEANIASQNQVSLIRSNIKYVYDKNNIIEPELSIASTADQNPASRINSIMNYLYDKNMINESEPSIDSTTDQNPASRINSNINYLYEKYTNGGHNLVDVRIASQNSAPEISSSDLNYLYEKKGIEDRTIPDLRIDHKIGTSDKNTNIKLNNGEYINKSNIGSHINQLLTGLEEGQMDTTDSASGTNTLLGSLIRGKASVTKETYPVLLSGFDPSKFEKDTSYKVSESSLSARKYAVVVGINNYADRTSLHSSVNDANSISNILKSLGYDVIELTDRTADKPTKHNILEGALKEIALKKGIADKVLIYFSGHGDVDDKNNFYLVPQDGDGNPSSCISEEELNSYLSGIKNLAIIIDSCNSGAFKATTGQVLLASSQHNEPSNEVWTEPVSVFTYFLCQAMKEEEKGNREIIIQSCFKEAKENTIQWSGSHLLNQTPMLKDNSNSNGRYYLS